MQITASEIVQIFKVIVSSVTPFCPERGRGYPRIPIGVRGCERPNQGKVHYILLGDNPDTHTQHFHCYVSATGSEGSGAHLTFPTVIHRAIPDQLPTRQYEFRAAGSSSGKSVISRASCVELSDFSDSFCHPNWSCKQSPVRRQLIPLANWLLKFQNE